MKTGSSKGEEEREKRTKERKKQQDTKCTKIQENIKEASQEHEGKEIRKRSKNKTVQ